jgi:hypothetical protein
MSSRLSRALGLVALLGLLGFSQPARSLEVIPLLTTQSYVATDGFLGLGGCCKSGTLRSGIGGIVRSNFESIGTWDVFGMSDIKWNEVAVLRPVYLLGEEVKFDPNLDSSTQIRRVRRYTLIWSYGAGIFTHNTRTREFDLATLVTGITVISHFEFQYSINDMLSLVAVARVGAGLSLDDVGAIINPMGGLLWRF